MKRYAKQKITIKTVLAASCIGMILWGCGKNEKASNKLVIEPIVSEEDTQTISETGTQETPEKETQTTSEEPQAASEEPQETASGSQTLYEQFLNNSISATVSNDYFFGGYAEQLLGKNASLTLTELNNSISDFYFDSEHTDKSSCDSMQYAYVASPDSSGENECWARSETTAYENGILRSSGSSGAGDHGADLSVILSDGKVASIYSAEILSGEWTSYVNGSIYSEVIDENTVPPALTVAIYTIGDETYYQYDMSYCEEEEIPLCEEYIGRCRNEAGINWVSAEEIQTAVQNQCAAAGIDYSTVEQWEEAKWNGMP